MYTNWTTNGSSGSEAKPNLNIQENPAFRFILTKPAVELPKLETNKERAVRVFQEMFKAILKANGIHQVQHEMTDDYRALILTGDEGFIMTMILSKTLRELLQKQRTRGMCIPLGNNTFMRDAVKAEQAMKGVTITHNPNTLL